MYLGVKSCDIDGNWATLEQVSADGRISRVVNAQTTYGTDIKDTFEKNPIDKTLSYHEVYEKRGDRGRVIYRKEVKHNLGNDHRIKIKKDNYEMTVSANIDGQGNRISPWKVDCFESLKTNFYAWNDSIQGLPDKISDLPKQVQKSYVEFFEKCEKLLNQYRKEQGMI